MSAKDSIRYLVFDIESVADPALIAATRTNFETEPTQALREYRDELMEKKGSDFIPHTFQIPISLALGKVRDDFSLADITVLRVEDGGPRKICERFWDGWRYYDRPTFVTFNGRGFDVPLMELTAFRYGIPVPEWFAVDKRSFDQPRNRYGSAHLDLYDFLTNFGATQFVSGLNVAAKILRKPGKIGTKGDMVQDMFDAGELDEIHRYCRCDVLDAYFVFLRTQVLCGRITPEREAELVDETRRFLEDESVNEPIYATYLDAWDAADAYFAENDVVAERVEAAKRNRV